MQRSHVPEKSNDPVESAPARQPGLRLRFFGAFEALHGETPLPRTRTRKEQWLLAILTLRHGQAVDRSWLAGTLWPDASEERALAYLRTSLCDLRRVLGPDASRLSTPAARTVRLDLSGAGVDLLEFEQLHQRGDTQDLETAVRLYRGPLLEGCAEEWVFPERERFREAHLRSLETLAAAAMTDDRPADAVHPLRLAVATDPLRESTYRSLMEALAKCGDLASVTQVYRDLRLLLHRELNAAPSAETTDLFECVRVTSVGGGNARQAASGRRSSVPRGRLVFSRQLPRPLTSLIGRDREARETAASLTDAPLVTLTGTGGVGKTRLAIRVAQDLAETYPDGACFVELASVNDPGLVAAVIAVAVGVREEPGSCIEETLTTALRSKAMLLVLDNCEHLIEGCAALTQRLLRECPQLRFLVTSRESLKVDGEVVRQVRPLAIPSERALGTIEGKPEGALLEYDAVQLFAERAALADPEATLSLPEQRMAALICRRLDGIPLAIELAAARVRSLSLEAIAERLDNRFRLLVGGSRTALPRQQTLRALIDWSYDLLTEPEQALLRHLSVFAGGWTLEAAQTLEGGEVEGASRGFSSEDVVDLLFSLIDKSLVLYERGERGGRYRLLETVRQYAWDKMVDAGEAESARGAHARFFVAMVQEEQRHDWEARLNEIFGLYEREHDNLRAALDWCAASDSERRAGLELAVELCHFWEVRGHLAEGREWSERLAQRGDAFPEQRAEALLSAARLAIWQGDYEPATALCDEAIAVYYPLHSQQGMALALTSRGTAAYFQGEMAKARADLENALAAWQALGDSAQVGAMLNNLGNVAMMEGRNHDARALLDEALECRRQLRVTRGVAVTLGNLGRLANREGDPARARTLFRESLILRRDLEDDAGVSSALHGLAAASLIDRRGDPEEMKRVARLFAAADTLRVAIGSPPAQSDRHDYEEHLAVLRRALVEDELAAAWSEGRALRPHQAIEEAMKDD